jgi:hypothetical protein
MTALYVARYLNYVFRQNLQVMEKTKEIEAPTQCVMSSHDTTASSGWLMPDHGIRLHNTHYEITSQKGTVLYNTNFCVLQYVFRVINQSRDLSDNNLARTKTWI